MLIVGKSPSVAWYPAGNICKYSHRTFKIALLSADYLCEWHPLWKTQRVAQGWDGKGDVSCQKAILGISFGDSLI